MTDKALIDPATLSGTELLLRQKHCPETLIALSSPGAPQAPVAVEVLPVHKEAAKASDMSIEELAEMMEVELRARKLVEAAKQAQKNKGKQ
ncbi:hypothetical protein [Pseudomonas kilonensis]|uniref:hypothetical protein n=1 Tax=Pseudomonas kilonensis TaxID=132476 RepID=UPI000AD5DF5B|nr:hypothetical protein [Pseudomonas kilonensis]